MIQSLWHLHSSHKRFIFLACSAVSGSMKYFKTNFLKLKYFIKYFKRKKHVFFYIFCVAQRSWSWLVRSAWGGRSRDGYASTSSSSCRRAAASVSALYTANLCCCYCVWLTLMDPRPATSNTWSMLRRSATPPRSWIKTTPWVTSPLHLSHRGYWEPCPQSTTLKNFKRINGLRRMYQKNEFSLNFSSNFWSIFVSFCAQISEVIIIVPKMLKRSRINVNSTCRPILPIRVKQAANKQ